MGGFSVQVPAVDALSFRVQAAASDVRSAEGKLAATSCVDAGYADLTGSLGIFQQFWSSFTDGAASSVASTASAISSAAVQYQTVDSTVMVDPSITSAFVQSTLDGNDGMSQLLLGPLLPGATTSPPASPTTPGLPFLPGGSK